MKALLQFLWFIIAGSAGKIGSARWKMAFFTQGARKGILWTEPRG